MRWFKCLVLCVGHLLVMLSLAFITVSDEVLENEKKHFLKWFGMIMGTGLATIICGSYLIALPILTCIKKSKIRVHFFIVFTSICYFINLSLLLWALQHMLTQATIMQCYVVSGQIGLVFGLLVL